MNVNDCNAKNDKDEISLDLFFSIFEVSEKDRKFPEGKYLQIAVKETRANLLKPDFTDEIMDDEYHISYRDYLAQLESSRTKRTAPEISQTMASELDIKTSGISGTEPPDYESFINFILQKSKLNVTRYADVVGLELTINSDSNLFLEIPWENVFKSAVVYRKYHPEEESVQYYSDQSSNFVFLTSHAHKNVGHDLKPFMDLEIGTIYNEINKLRTNNSQSMRVDMILLCKHTTRKSLSEIDWKRFNFLHLICHGDQDGDPAFEKDDPMSYKYVDIVKKDEFVDKLIQFHFKLCFLSMCNSAGGRNVKVSLAFQLVKEGVASFCIAYHDRVIDKAAKSFASHFYDHLLQGKNIKETYKESLLAYKLSEPNSVNIPYLFSRL